MEVIKATEEERQRRIGRIIAGKEILDVVGWYRTMANSPRKWLLIAKCPQCGKPFKVKELSLYGKSINCGCTPRSYGTKLRESGHLLIKTGSQSRAEGQKLREEAIKAAVERRLGKVEQEDEPTYQAEKPSQVKWFGRDAVANFTRERVLAYWGSLDKKAMCPAWQDFEKFYDWAIRNGFHREKVLVRLDTTKLMSPLTCKWSLP